MISKDGAYETRVRDSFRHQSHMITLGAEIVFIAPGDVHLAFPFDPQFCQQNGFMHAGAIASVADSTMLSTIIVRPRTSGGSTQVAGT